MNNPLYLNITVGLDPPRISFAVYFGVACVGAHPAKSKPRPTPRCNSESVLAERQILRQKYIFVYVNNIKNSNASPFLQFNIFFRCIFHPSFSLNVFVSEK